MTTRYEVPYELLAAYRQTIIPDYLPVTDLDPDGFRAEAAVADEIFALLRERAANMEAE